MPKPSAQSCPFVCCQRWYATVVALPLWCWRCIGTTWLSPTCSEYSGNRHTYLPVLAASSDDTAWQFKFPAVQHLQSIAINETTHEKSGQAVLVWTAALHMPCFGLYSATAVSFAQGFACKPMASPNDRIMQEQTSTDYQAAAVQNRLRWFLTCKQACISSQACVPSFVGSTICRPSMQD